MESLLPDVQVLMGADVLVGIYLRPDKTAGGIVLPDKYLEEDVWQGKVGLVLMMGQLAFVDDEDHRFGDRRPQVGDWVVSRVGDGFPLYIGDQPCRLVSDTRIKMVVARPDLVY